MKTWTVILVFCILLWGCNEDVLGPVVDPVPDEIEPKEYTISASANMGVVLNPQGKYTVKNGVSMVFSYLVDSGRQVRFRKVNGGVIASYPNKLYEQINDTSIMLTADHSDVSLRIESISNDSINIMGAGWYLQESWDQDLIDNSWSKLIPEDKEFKLKIVFTDYAGGSATWYDENNKIFGGPYVWFIQGKILSVGSSKFTIVYLDNKKLVLDIKTSLYSVNRKTYTKIPKKLN